MSTDPRQYAPAAARNREPIFSVIRPFLPDHGVALEVASGSGEHITGLAKEHASGLVFQPSDPDPDARQSIDAWTSELALNNVRPALALDAASSHWPITSADFVFCINMIHISPREATEGLLHGASKVLSKGNVLFTYGPYRRSGVHTSPGNEAFDKELRQRNAAWGIRDVEELATLAATSDFTSPEIFEMPANNLSLVFRRR